MYPAGEIDPGNVWAAALRGLTMDDIRRGLNALVDKRIEWPPSAIEFLNLCDQANDKDVLPSIGSAVVIFIRQIAMAQNKRNWHEIHPAVYWCYQQIGSFDCANMSQDKLAARFKDFWPLAVELAKAGKLQATVDAQIEDKSESGKCTPGVADEEIKKLKGMF